MTSSRGLLLALALVWAIAVPVLHGHAPGITFHGHLPQLGEVDADGAHHGLPELVTTDGAAVPQSEHTPLPSGVLLWFPVLTAATWRRRTQARSLRRRVAVVPAPAARGSPVARHEVAVV